jgi:hypothetical protein
MFSRRKRRASGLLPRLASSAVPGPAALDAALEADSEETRHRDEVLEAFRRDLEAARYAADKAFRQYDATDPANRLVAAELELRWNRTLERVTELERRIERHVSEIPAKTPTNPEQFATLATDLNVIWRDPTTDARLKKRIVRELIREVIADLDAQGKEIILVVHWMGGVHTELRLPRRRRGRRNSNRSGNCGGSAPARPCMQRRRDRGRAQPQ